MIEFTGEESNRFVLEQVVEALREGIDRWVLINRLDAFLGYKEKILDEIGELTKKARGGDREAARKVIQLMAEINDGQ